MQCDLSVDIPPNYQIVHFYERFVSLSQPMITTVECTKIWHLIQLSYIINSPSVVPHGYDSDTIYIEISLFL